MRYELFIMSSGQTLYAPADFKTWTGVIWTLFRGTCVFSPQTEVTIFNLLNTFIEGVLRTTLYPSLSISLLNLLFCRGCVCVCHVPHFYISYIGVGRLVNIFYLILQSSNLHDKSMFHALKSWLLYIRWC